MTEFIVHSAAIIRCRFALWDVLSLLKLHDVERERGRPLDEVDYLRRAAVILTVTAWETFVEDSVRFEALRLIERAGSPADVPHAFQSLKASALDPRKVGELRLEQWTGDGWKDLLRAKLKADVSRLNSPTSSNVRSLSKTHLGFDISREWSWRGMPASNACNHLDKLIKVRGGLVHQSKPAFDKSPLRLRNAKAARNLIRRLAEKTESVLQERFRDSA